MKTRKDMRPQMELTNDFNGKSSNFVTNGNVRVADLYHKYIFWDIDGTLAPYRFNNHVADPNGTDNGMSLEEIDNGMFLLREPSKHMQNVLKSCNAKEHIVMGHCQVEKEMQDKQIWLDKYYPMIKERLLVYENVSKADSILQYCENHAIDLQDVVYVDDVIPFLREAERKGIKSYHISSFLDWDYQFTNENHDAFFAIHNG